ncbi:MAG: hypothetical protein M3O30_14575 [Planctomycetota bacterium]|nr:hypothetical protein [Planctomycetota bacterium]
MIISASNTVKFILLAGAALLLTGCSSDMLTYSQDAKHAGIREYNDGRYPEASGSFRNAVRQDPTDPEAQYWLGMSEEQTHSSHEAIVAYKTALGLMPKAGSARFDRSLYDNTFDRLAKVIAETDASNTETDLLVKTAAEKNSPEQYQLLGRICRYRGDADTALEDYHRSLALDTGNFATQKELGLYLQQLSQNQQAAQVLRDAYRINQRDDAVNEGLRRLGIVPGPALLAQDQIARPLMPNGPIPDLVAPAAHTAGPAADSNAPRD